uniref:Clone 1160 transcribed RNA sequence n=1 Tax=Plectreurys tristis TaxID=33319 RepID=A0A0C4W5S3_PLETR|nr:sulfotransferase-like protein [Plectreurys tristis]
MLYVFRYALPRSTSAACFRLYGSNAFNHDNLKRINLSKKLITTALFGGTLLVALWCKKRKVSEAFREATLINKNDLYKSSLVMYDYRGFVLPKFVLKSLDSLEKFECREDDIFVVTFPKTGTTWLQEIVYCIMNDLDFSSAAVKSIEDRFPYLEFVFPGLATINKMPSPRFIKTHLPYSLLPADVHQKKPKFLMVQCGNITWTCGCTKMTQMF